MNERLVAIKKINKGIKIIETEIQLRKRRVDRIHKFLQQLDGKPGQKEWEDAYNGIVCLHMDRLIDLNERLLSLEMMARRVES